MPFDQEAVFHPSRLALLRPRRFIEYRPDGRNGACFVTYVKIEGSWYQCDDDRITALRSTIGSVPLLGFACPAPYYKQLTNK